jgi:transposase
MRGVAFVAAVTFVAEVGDFTGFDNPRQVMAYLGLTPSEQSSGTATRRGGIIKAGNALARRVLIEGLVNAPGSSRLRRLNAARWSWICPMTQNANSS